MRHIIYTSLLLLSFFTLLAFAYQPISSLNSFFNEAYQQHAFPGGCVQTGDSRHIQTNECFGHFTYKSNEKDTVQSEFDIASLTKVVATTSAIMILYDQGEIKLNDKVIHYLPQFSNSHVTILQLLTHTSGLPADIDAGVLKKLSPTARINKVIETPLIHAPGSVYTYSDINFILLGKIVEKISHLPFNVFVEKYVFQPLNMKHTFFNPSFKYTVNIVPTSYSKEKHGLLIGTVDDPLARALGGIAGNAGLFSTTHDLGLFAQMMLNGGVYQGKRIFKASTIDLFTHRANLLPNNSRALGWDTAYDPDAPDKRTFTAGPVIDRNGYGHTGYTGTSIWISKKDNFYAILLTNRVTPTIDNERSEKYWREKINGALWARATSK